MTKKDTKFSKDNQPSTRGEGEPIAKSNVKRKIMTDALMLALNREVDEVADDGSTKPTKQIAVIAKKLVEIAAQGNTKAIQEIFDRTEGKAAQAIELTGKDGGPIETVDYSGLSDSALAELMAAINAKTNP